MVRRGVGMTDETSSSFDLCLIEADAAPFQANVLFAIPGIEG